MIFLQIIFYDSILENLSVSCENSDPLITLNPCQRLVLQIALEIQRSGDSKWWPFSFHIFFRLILKLDQ